MGEMTRAFVDGRETVDEAAAYVAAAVRRNLSLRPSKEAARIRGNPNDLAAVALEAAHRLGYRAKKSVPVW